MNLLNLISTLRIKAMRRRIWFRVLDAYERELLTLVLRHIKMVRNKQLAIVLARIAVRLMYSIDATSVRAYTRAYTWMKHMVKMGWIESIDIVSWFIMIERSLVYR